MLFRQKHFVLFFIVGIALNIIGYLLIAEHFKQGSGFAKFVNIAYLFYPVILCAAMILTYRTETRMDLMRKLVPCIVYVTLHILIGIALNFLNPYGREIDQEDIENGIGNSFMVGSIQIILLICLLPFLKPRIKPPPN